jgi:hypothetical protein
MKYAFKIKTEPQAAVVIVVVVTSSGALATIAVSLDNPSVTIYCVTVFSLFTWIELTKTKLSKTKIPMMAPMDPSASTPGIVAPSSTLPPVGPRILQLFYFPGII